MTRPHTFTCRAMDAVVHPCAQPVRCAHKATCRALPAVPAACVGVRGGALHRRVPAPRFHRPTVGAAG